MCPCVWRGQVCALHLVPLVNLVIFVLYLVIFITWSQLLQLYNTLTISKTLSFFASCKIILGVLHLSINFRISLSSPSLNKTTKDLRGLDGRALSLQVNLRTLDVFILLSFPTPATSHHTHKLIPVGLYI